MPIEVLGKALQIDVCRIHGFIKRRPRLRSNIASRDRDGFYARRPASLGAVNRIFRPNDWVIVRVGNAAAPELEGRLCDGFWRSVLAELFNLLRFADRPVLAEFAAQIAAGGAERQDAGAGIELIQWLLLNRVNAKAGAAAIGRKDHLAVTIFAYEAEAAIAGPQMAVARAKIADNAACFGIVVPPAAKTRAVRQETIVGWESHHTRHIQTQPDSD